MLHQKTPHDAYRDALKSTSALLKFAIRQDPPLGLSPPRYCHPYSSPRGLHLEFPIQRFISGASQQGIPEGFMPHYYWAARASNVQIDGWRLLPQTSDVHTMLARKWALGSRLAQATWCMQLRSKYLAEEVDVDVIFGWQVGFARGACAVQFEGFSTQDDDDSGLD